MPMKDVLINKYHLKIPEAEMLADFLNPMLNWYPDQRATAQEMLEHPWLKMPAEYNVRMTDFEYKKYQMKQTINDTHDDRYDPTVAAGSPAGKNRAMEKPNAKMNQMKLSDLADSDRELDDGDVEDNVSLDSDDSGCLNDSLTGPPGAMKDSDEKDEEEFNLNISFAGGYMPNTDLTRVDKGAGNPQFSGYSIV